MKTKIIILSCCFVCLFTWNRGKGQSLFPKKVIYASKTLTAECLVNTISIYGQNIQGKPNDKNGILSTKGKLVAELTARDRLPSPLPPCLPEHCHDLILRFIDKDKYSLLFSESNTSITLIAIKSSVDFNKQLSADGNRFLLEGGPGK